MTDFARPDSGTRAAHLTFAIIGTLLLIAACGVTLLVGAFSGFLTDNCVGDDFEAGGPAHCRNAGWVMLALIGTPIVAGTVALIATWRTKSRGRPRGWAPFVGIVFVAAAWVVVSLLVPGKFLF